MGMGQFVILDCPCGFRSNRARIGSLLAHESSLDGYTVIVATFDTAKREIVTHSACLPPELDSLADDDLVIDDWFDREHEAVRANNGPLLTPSSDGSTSTDYPCPDCGRDLQLKADGSWIA